MNRPPAKIRLWLAGPTAGVRRGSGPAETVKALDGRNAGRPECWTATTSDDEVLQTCIHVHDEAAHD